MKEIEYFLITTADVRGWRNDDHILCLGSWCCTYKNKKSWKGLAAEVVPYHWDNREKLYGDYFYLKELHERLLLDISKSLNKFHKQNHSLRYWRILIGPWLLYFTQIIFDRWEMLEKANNDYSIRDTLIIENDSDKIIPNNMLQFREMYTNDCWNYAIFSRIIKDWFSIKFQKVIPSEAEIINIHSIDKARDSKSTKSFLSKLLSTYNKISLLFTRESNAFLISTFLPIKIEFLLQIFLGQVPGRIDVVEVPGKIPEVIARKTFTLDAKKYHGFENCLRTLIVEQIPTSYLEGYEELVEKTKELSWPKFPRFIFTSVSYNSDEIFKAWAGEQVDKGVPLIIAQHGGNIGTALWSSTEDHEIAISDRYITWGWKSNNKNIFPVGILKSLQNKQITWNPRGSLLLVSSVMPRYSYVLGSYTIANSQVYNNLEDQYNFVKALSQRIKSKLVVRLFVPDWGWDQASRWNEKFPEIHLNSGSGSIDTLMSDCRLYIATYNATTFLESLSNNIPTIAFWNPEHWELRDQAKLYFDKLQKAEILFSCPEKAAAKVEEVWDNVDNWWTNAEVQEARLQFCDQYAKKQLHPIKELKKAVCFPF